MPNGGLHGEHCPEPPLNEQVETLMKKSNALYDENERLKHFLAAAENRVRKLERLLGQKVVKEQL